MRTVFIGMLRAGMLAALLLPVFSAMGQAHYGGGQGGGYASVNVTISTYAAISDTLTNRNFDASVFPNPVKKGEALRLRLKNTDRGSKTRVLVNDMLGNRIVAYEIERGAGESEIILPFDKMGRGLYLITFQNGKSRVTRRVTLVE